MNNPNHTPGPWGYHSPAIISGNTQIGIIDTSHANAGLEDGEGEANANLIAASPDLFYALDVLAHEAFVVAAMNPDNKALTDAVVIARKVLDQARGK